MENIVLQFLNVYFWVFIVMFSFNIIGKSIIKTLKPEYELQLIQYLTIKAKEYKLGNQKE